MPNVKDFSLDPLVPIYLKKISNYDEKIIKKIFTIFDKIDNTSQFSIELKKTLSEITDNTKDNSRMFSEIGILKYVLQMMTVENIKNEQLEEFFEGIIDLNSIFFKYFKTIYDEKFIVKFINLIKMDTVLNKYRFSILNLDYDINLRSRDLTNNEKPVAVISFHMHDSLGKIEADCSVKDIDYLIEELNDIKEKAKGLEKINVRV